MLRSFFDTIICLALLSACAPTDTDNQEPIAENSNITEPTYTDEEVAQNIETGERYNFWIAEMDQYIDQNDDWTYTLDWQGFIVGIEVSHPEIYEHYENNGPANEDTEVIDGLTSGIPIANESMLELYESYQNMPEGMDAWVSNRSYWWGRQSCFGSGTEDWMLNIMRTSSSAASTIAAYVGAPVWLINAYLSRMISAASWCDSNRGYFCISYYYSGFMWVNC